MQSRLVSDRFDCSASRLLDPIARAAGVQRMSQRHQSRWRRTSQLCSTAPPSSSSIPSASTTSSIPSSSSCDLSTAARGLLRPQLETQLHGCPQPCLCREDGGCPGVAGVEPPDLGFLRMQCSLQLLPEVEVFDLRRNRMAYVTNLERCGRLKYLDLGFNRIQSVSRLQQVASSRTVLVLRFNALATRGIETLYLLRSLDLSHNIISNFHEVEKFESLRFLVCLNLESNPVTFAGDYRERVFSVFLEPAKVCLDGRYLSRIENWKVQKLIVKRSKRDGAVGLYSPAVKPLCDGRPKSDDDFEEEFTKAKKKSTRLAVIADDDGKSKRVSPVVSATEETSLLNNVEEVETRLQHFMERVEVLKKDKPKFWLSEVSSLFESNADLGSQEQSSESTSERRQKIKSARKSSRKRELGNSRHQRATFS